MDAQRLAKGLNRAIEVGDMEAAKELRAALRAAQGPSIMDQTAEPERATSQREAEIAGLRHGGTLGWGPEVMAGLGARADTAYEGLRGIGVPEGIARPLGAAGSLFMPSTEGDGYESLRDDYQGELEQSREDWPATAYGMEIAGALGSGLGVAQLANPLLRGITSFRGKLGAYSALGAAEGAVYGAGENDADRGRGALVGGSIGAAAGPAGAAVGGAMGWTGRTINKMVSDPASLAGENARRILSQVARDEGVSSDAVMTWLRQNPDMTLADYSDRFRDTMLRATGYASNRERTLAQDFYRVRNANAGPRLEAEADGILGTQGRTFRGTVDELKVERGAIGDQQYSEIFRQAPEFVAEELGEEAVELLKRPSLQRALRMARKSAKDEPQAPGAARAAAADPDAPEVTTWENLHNAQTELQDMIGAAQRAGKNGKARRLIGLKDEVQQLLDANLPGYNTARAEFATTHQIERAARQGRELFRGSTPFEELDDMTRLEGDQARAFVVGAKDAIRQRIRETGDNAVHGVLTPAQRHRLKSVLPEDEASELFRAFDLEREAGLSGVLSERARTRTADAPPLVSGDAGMAMTNPVLVITRAIQRALAGAERMTPETSDQLLQLLARAQRSRTPAETAAIEAALEKILARGYGAAASTGGITGGAFAGILEE